MQWTIRQVSRRARGVAGGTAICALAALCAAPAVADPISFSVVQNQSSLDLTANLSIFGGALTVTEQAGTRATSYTGTMETVLTPGLIKFPGGSSVNADFQRTGGIFNPPAQLVPGPGGDLGNPDPGNYGITATAPINIVIPPIDIPGFGTINLGTLSAVDIDVALRNMSFDLTAGSSLLRSGVNNQDFDASAVDLSLIAGDADIAVSAVLTMPDLLTKTATLLLLQTLAGQLPPEIPLSVSTPGIFSLDINIGAGFTAPIGGLGALPNSATGGLIQQVGPNYRLTVPVDIDPLPEIPPILADLLGLEVEFNLTGQFVGTAPYRVVVPEPSSLALCGLAMAIGLGCAARRRSGR